MLGTVQGTCYDGGQERKYIRISESSIRKGLEKKASYLYQSRLRNIPKEIATPRCNKCHKTLPTFILYRTLIERIEFKKFFHFYFFLIEQY